MLLRCKWPFGPFAFSKLIDRLITTKNTTVTSLRRPCSIGSQHDAVRYAELGRRQISVNTRRRQLSSDICCPSCGTIPDTRYEMLFQRALSRLNLPRGTNNFKKWGIKGKLKSRNPAACRCCCQSTGQTDGRMDTVPLPRRSIIIIISIPSPLTFFCKILPTAAFLFLLRTDSTDCFPILLSIPVYYFLVFFTVFHFLVVGSVR